MVEIIKELGHRVKNGELTWRKATEIYNEKTNENITHNALRKRYAEMLKRETRPSNAPRNSKTVYGDGTVEAEDIVNLSPEVKDNPRLVLKELGYNPDEWELIYMQFSNWTQHTKLQETKHLYSVKFKLKPKIKDLEKEKVFEIIDKQVIDKIKPFKLASQPKIKDLDEDKIILLGAVELHLGKEAREFDVGENYNINIAIERYQAIVEAILIEQEHKQASKLIYGIGNDFINVDTPSNTTTKGTQQLGGTSSYELFDIALNLQLKALLTLREHFNDIEVVLVKGNHANTLEYTLYRGLQQRFIEDSVIEFRNDYKDIQAIKEGNTSIFMTHGDMNYKRTIEQMSNEFYKIYGDTEHRYILLGHLHHKQQIEELNGFTVFRLSSPSGVDRWLYKERYLAKAGQEIFTFDKNEGLVNIKYLTFDKVRTR